MEDKNKPMKCECEGGLCNCKSMYKHHHTGRFILAILVVTLAFWVGIKLGEIKGFMLANGYMANDRREVVLRKMHSEMPKRGPEVIIPAQDIQLPETPAQAE